MLRPRSAPAALVIRQEDPAQPDVVELLRHGEAFSARRYPPESNHHLPLDALRRPEVRFLVARDAEGKPWRPALLFYTTVGLKLNECGLKRLHGAEE
jgi:hypothetical protein